jgi:metallo-beta-lactamase class B
MMSPRSLATLVFALVLGLAAAPRVRSEPARDSVTLGPDLEVRRLRPGYWVHVSRDAQGIPANGMIVRTKRGLLIVDTGWSADQTERLLAWSRGALGGRVREAIITHSHNDRTGGLAALARHHIPVVALDLTADRLRQGGAAEAPGRLFTAARRLFTAAEAIRADPLGFEAFYPGAGHAPDNIVVWFPAERILFGGCLVKAEVAPDLGNVADADLAHWPSAVDAVRARYPEAAIVVPGHGPVGTLQALVHTVDLLRARAAATPGGGR